MRRGIVFATDVLEPLIELSGDAEDAGFDSVWTTEYRGRDAVARALAIALRTERIRVGTGVAYAFTRAPLAMAALAADVQRLARGRFALGITAGTRGVRRWYGAEFEPPATALIRYVDELRRVWSDTAAYPRVPPILLPAFNPVMTRRAAAVADGLLLHPLAAGTAHLHERVLPAIARGAAERAVPPELIAWRIVSIDVDEARARERAGMQLAFYLSTPSYATALEGTPWSDVPAAVRTRFDQQRRDPDWRQVATGVPSDMIDEFALAGTVGTVRDALRRTEAQLADVGVGEIVCQTVGAGLPEDEVVGNCRAIVAGLGRWEQGEDGTR